MTGDRWRRMWRLFHEARSVAENDRRGWLEERCPDDTELVAEILDLLASDAKTGGLLDDPGAAGRPVGLELGPSAGDRLGPFRLEERLGEGGMGVVYRATQEEPIRRSVAVKLVRDGFGADQLVERFNTERRALALMDHPNIARVYEAGTTENGHPFFAMELADGPTLPEYCDHRRLTLRERLELFIPVCHAVQHAHQKGIIHRDLKPNNLLVAEIDDRPMAKVIDFGIARGIEENVLGTGAETVVGTVLGTPEYMSPEQADPAVDVDTRSDIYSLGVVLYELLTGRRPIEVGSGTSYVDFLGRVRDSEIAPPSRRAHAADSLAHAGASARRTTPDGLRRQLRGPLDWIVMRALEKDRDARYAAASDLAADLERFLADEPVAASPPSPLYRARTFARRHRWSLATAALVLALLVIQLATASIQSRRIAAALEQSRSETARAERITEFLIGLFESSDPSQSLGDETTARDILDRGSAAVIEQLEEAPETRAALEMTMSEVYGNLGLFLEAEELARRGMETRQSTLGVDHPDTLASINDLGVWVRRQERFDEARELLTTAYERRREVLGADHPDTLASGQNLATMLIEEGRLDDGEALLRELLLIQDRVLGPENPSTMTTVNVLAIALQKLGREPEAEPLVRRVLDHRSRTLGPDDPSTLRSWSNLGTVLKTAGRSAEAAEVFEAALDARRRVLGGDHPHTLITAQNLAATYADLGRIEEAESMLREVLARHRARLGDDHSLVLVTAHNLAKTLIMAELYRESESIYRDILARAEANLPETHPYRGVFRSGLGASLAEQDRTDEARIELEAAAAFLEIQLGPDHRHTLEAIRRLESLPPLQTDR